MKISYLFHDTDNRNTYHGNGTMDTFNIGMAQTNNSGTFTNTSDKVMSGPIYVLAALTEKSTSTIEKMNALIESGDVPVNFFMFIPSASFSVWSRISQRDSRFWANLPMSRVEAGKTVSGYYIPLTALPPFTSRAEIGTVAPEDVTFSVGDYFKLASVYFNSKLSIFAQRIQESRKYVSVDTSSLPETYTMQFTRVANANVYYTFSNIIYQAVGFGTPMLQVKVSSVMLSNGGFIVTYKLTSDISGKPRHSIKKTKSNFFEIPHSIDTVGNSGFINNMDVSFFRITTKSSLPVNVKQVYVDNKPFTVAAIDYTSKSTKRVSLYVQI